MDVLPIHLEVGTPLVDLFEIGAILQSTGQEFQQDEVFQCEERHRQPEKLNRLLSRKRLLEKLQISWQSEIAEVCARLAFWPTSK